MTCPVPPRAATPGVAPPAALRPERRCPRRGPRSLWSRRCRPGGGAGSRPRPTWPAWRRSRTRCRRGGRRLPAQCRGRAQVLRGQRNALRSAGRSTSQDSDGDRTTRMGSPSRRASATWRANDPGRRRRRSRSLGGQADHVGAVLPAVGDEGHPRPPPTHVRSSAKGRSAWATVTWATPRAASWRTPSCTAWLSPRSRRPHHQGAQVPGPVGDHPVVAHDGNGQVAGRPDNSLGHGPGQLGPLGRRPAPEPVAAWPPRTP